MGTPGQLKTKVDRLKKKLAAKGPSLDAGKRRLLHKKLKRFQRAWRTALALEKRRVAEKGKGGKPAAEVKPSAAAPEKAATPEAATPEAAAPEGAAPEATAPEGAAP